MVTERAAAPQVLPRRLRSSGRASAAAVGASTARSSSSATARSTSTRCRCGLHPAESRIRRLSAEIPASSVVFDVLVWRGEPVWKLPFEERRAELERVGEGFRLSPSTRALAEARGWLDRCESLGLDGVIAKRLAAPYLPGPREGMVKVKEHKTADCVVAGIRWKGAREQVATPSILGLWERGRRARNYVGFRARLRQSRAPRWPRRCCRSSRKTPSGPRPSRTAGARARSRKRASGPSSWSRCVTKPGCPGQPVPSRHEADPLARDDGRPGRLHVARAAAGTS